MTQSKLSISFGTLSFSGEGESEWLSEQLWKVVERAPSLAESLSAKGELDTNKAQLCGDRTAPTSGEKVSLVTFLRTKNASTNQIIKFLATAVWLHNRGKARLTTGDITGALKDNQQNRLTNASECLNQNVGKGFCEKDGAKEFFVTEEGRLSLQAGSGGKD